MGQRELVLTRELYIDRADFREQANKKYKRLVLGKRVRLRNAYVVEADEVDYGEDGEVSVVRARVVEDSLGKEPGDGVKPRGVIHWVAADHGIPVELRLYDRLFTVEAPDKGGEEFSDYLNLESLRVVERAMAEPGLADALPEQGFQFEREGYFVADRFDHSSSRPVFNKTIGLRDTWARSGEQ